MKFTTEVIRLAERLGLIQGIAERRATMPILSHVLVLVSKGKIKLSATDLETTIITWFDASEVTKEGSLALPARKLYEIIKELPQGEIEIEDIGNHWLEIRSPSATFKIAGLPSEDFPLIPEVSSENLFSVESSVMDEMIAKTLYAVSPDDLRRNLAGIYFEKVGKQSIRLVATDGHRLSLVEKDIGKEINLKRNFVVPKKGVSELRKMLKLSDNVSIGCGKNDFIAAGEEFTLIIRLIDAEFPDYKQVIPEVTKMTLQVKQSEFLSAIRRVSILSAEKTKSIKMKVADKTMTLASVSPEIGEAKEVVPIDYNGDSVELGFNARYLMDALEVMNEDTVQMGITDELSPAVIKPVGESVYVSVIMPMRV